MSAMSASALSLTNWCACRTRDVSGPARRHPSEDVVNAPNDCEYSPLLSPFHDGELSPDRLAAVAAHVRGCQVCAAELAEIRQFARAFRSTARPTAPPPERWESAVLDAARDEGLLADSNASPRRRMRLVGGTGADDAVYGQPASPILPNAGKVAEPRHLWFVRRLSAAAAVVFLIAAGQMAYQRYHGGTSANPNVETPVVDTHSKPHGDPSGSPKLGSTTGPTRD